MLNLLSGSTVIAQTIPVQVDVLKQIKGELDKKDSLLVISEQLISTYKSREINFTAQITNLNKQIKLETEKCKLVSLNTKNENLILKDENKTLKREKRFWKTLAIGIPTVIVGAGTYILLR